MAAAPRQGERTTAGRPARHPRRRIDRSVLWSGVIWLLTFPLMLVYLTVVGMVAGVFGVRLGDPSDADRELALNVLYMGMVLATSATGFFAGLAGWRRRRIGLALVCAVLNAATAVLFVVLPAL